MILYEQGYQYWAIAKRFHTNRQHKGMRPVAVNDMINLYPKSSSAAVKRRITSFISRHSTSPNQSA